MSRTGRRRPPGRAGAVLASLAMACALLAAASRTWVSARLPDPLGAAQGVPLEVTGAAAAGVVPALGLVALAAAAAMSTVRGPLLRATALLVAAAGAGALLATAGLLRDPGAAVATAARATAGTTSGWASSATSVATTPWPWVALLPAAGLLLTGVWATAAGPRWSSSARFEAPAAGAAGPGPRGSPGAPAARGPATLWDGLSRGDDPTR